MSRRNNLWDGPFLVVEELVCQGVAISCSQVEGRARAGGKRFREGSGQGEDGKVQGLGLKTTGLSSRQTGPTGAAAGGAASGLCSGIRASTFSTFSGGLLKMAQPRGKGLGKEIL